ncbi:hypothetical protein E4U50_007512 [Claviceps purpurea]|nr:hypothetical protein E4U51_008046 [Claviceps purpurea]KAG6198720.1 hypothetical protein E4U50_007512 [Claviceps purpurea]
MELVFDSRESQEAAALDNFTYLQQHKLIICKEHGYAVALKRHLSDYHTYPRSVQQAVLRRFHGLPLTETKDAVLPTAYELPIEGLAPPRKGYKCDEADCGWISSRRDKILKHCRTHGWKSTPGDRKHWTELWVQSFSLTPGKQRWFIVSVEEAQTTATAEPTSTDVLAVMDEISREHDAFCAREKEKMAVLVAELDPTDNTGWWNRTAWVTHLGKSHLSHLAHAARLPGTDEPELKVVANAVGELIEDCVGGLASARPEVLRYLRGVGDLPDQRPMMRLQNRSSQDVYINYWKRLICYSIRVAQSVQLCEAENEERGDEHDEDEEAVSVPEEDDDDVAGPIVQGDRMRDARRLFPWTDETRDQARRILHSVTCRTSLKRSILDFSRSLIMQKIYGSEFAQPMIHFMAILGINAENGTLREAQDYSYMLAGLVYCVRVISLELLLPCRDRHLQGAAEIENFIQQRKEYLQDGSMSVLSCMISLLAYGKRIAMEYGNAGSVFWEGEDRVMVLNGGRIVMAKFRAMVENAIDDAETLFWQRLMSTADECNRSELDFNTLTDDISFRRRGCSFLDNKSNGLSNMHMSVTLAKLLASKNGKKMWRDKKWNKPLTREYLRQVDKFRKLLLFCVHVTGGQPARGTEILSLRFANGVASSRNVFLLDGYVMTVTFYNKTDAAWDSPKIVPRFLPWRVGQLMASYLVYVEPLAKYLRDAIGDQSHGGEYIWADEAGPWDTSKLTSILKQRTGQDLGQDLGTLKFRHAAVGIGRRFVGDEFARGYKDEIGEVDEPEHETEDPLEMSAGRGSAMGANRYAVPSDLVKHLSQRNIDTFRPLSQSWHRFLGLDSRKGDKVNKQKRDGAEMQATPAKKTRFCLAGGPTTSATTCDQLGAVRAAAPATRIASTVLPTMPWTVEDEPRWTQSPPLHGFDVADDMFTPSISSMTTRPPSQAKLLQPDLQQRLQPDLQQRNRAVRKALRLPDSAPVTYKSPEQELALERIMNDTDPALVVVLPTGGGKSLLFIAPACLEDPGMTIVIVPYLQLINETLSDATARGIDAVEWTRNLEDAAELVIVSADKVHSSFLDYAARMAGKGRLRRIFVDECHLVITAHSWRPNLARLTSLRCIGASTIMLTATLPLHMESDLRKTMILEHHPSWLIRGCTARKNTRYMVKASVADGKLIEEAIKFCREEMDVLQHKSKMIVFCRSKRQCEELAEALGCDYFYGGSPDNADVIKRWKTSGGCVVATTALGTGVNYTSVAVTVHVGMPYGLIDFAQESGRAGRDGEVVASHILMEKGWQAVEQKRRQTKRQEWSLDEKEMFTFVNTVQCRRLVLGKYFDGDPAQDCISGDMVRCDRCRIGVSDWERSQQIKSGERSMVEDALDQIAIGCPVCWVTSALRVRNGSDHGWMHDGRACTRRETVNIMVSTGGNLSMSEDACDKFRKTVRYLDGGKMCHACGISQRMCRTGEDGKIRCQWPRIAPAIVRMATTNNVGRHIIREAGYMGDIDDWKAYALWLGQPHRLRLWDELVSNSMMVIKGFLIHCKREMTREPWEFNSDDDGSLGAAMEEIWSGEEAALVQADGVQEGHEEEEEPRRAQDSRVCSSGRRDPNIDMVYTGPEAVLKKRRLDEEALEKFEKRLKSLRGCCLMCRIKKKPFDHTPQSCLALHQLWRAKSDAIKTCNASGKEWIEPYTACFMCFMPQSSCNRANPETNAGLAETGKRSAGCDFADMILPLCYGAFMSVDPRALLTKKFDRFKDALDYMLWLGKKTEHWGVPCIQAVPVAAALLDLC